MTHYGMLDLHDLLAELEYHRFTGDRARLRACADQLVQQHLQSLVRSVPHAMMDAARSRVRNRLMSPGHDEYEPAQPPSGRAPASGLTMLLADEAAASRNLAIESRRRNENVLIAEWHEGRADGMMSARAYIEGLDPSELRPAGYVIADRGDPRTKIRSSRYWSDANGWTSLEHASVYGYGQALRVELPAGIDVRLLRRDLAFDLEHEAAVKASQVETKQASHCGSEGQRKTRRDESASRYLARALTFKL